MLSKEKAMYQTWLIIEGLSKKEKSLISTDLLNEIKNTMEKDENIKIDFSIPLEKQKLDTKTWSMLGKVMKSAERNGYKKPKKMVENVEETYNNGKGTNNFEMENENIETIKLENIKLAQELSQTKENVRELIAGYKKAFEDSQAENAKLRQDYEVSENEVEKLKQDCKELIQMFDRIPGFIRKIFVKDEKIKMLRGEL